MKLEHFGMAEPGDCRVVFAADAAELERAITAEQAAANAPQDEKDLLTAAVNRAILEGFSPLYGRLMDEHKLVPVTDPDFELLAVNRAEGFRAGAQFFALPPLELGRCTGFVQPIQPRPIRPLTVELEKKTPAYAGLGGGSADVAAVLRCLRRRYAPELSAEKLEAIGLEVGSDKHIIASLPTLGVEALLLSVCATVGSCVLAWVLWKTAKKGGAEQ